jgi:hypothetical protein
MIGAAIATALLLLPQATLAERAVPFEGDWRITAGRHFDLTFITAGPGDLERVSASAERAYRQISARLGHDLSLRPLIVVYRTGAERLQARAARTFPGNREHVLWALDVPASEADGEFLHELMHVFAFDIVPPGGRVIPAWLHEGLAREPARPVDRGRSRDRARVAAAGIAAVARTASAGGRRERACADDRRPPRRRLPRRACR